jgi:FkbM family methyltransferase
MAFWRNMRAYALDQWFIKNPVLRRFVTRLIYSDKDVEVNLFGTRLNINSARENGYLRAFRRAEHSSLWRDEVGSLLSLFAVLRPGDLFLDVGANIGVFACTAARLPGIEVMAFEAHPDTYTRLQANCQLAGVKAMRIAVSDVQGTMEFVDGAVSHVFAAAQHRNDYHSGPTITVECVRLDDIVTSSKSIVLKMDVEDHECAVLRGAARLLDQGLVQAVLLDASAEAFKAAEMLVQRGFLRLDSRTFGEVNSSTPSFLMLSKKRFELIGFEPDGERKVAS